MKLQDLKSRVREAWEFLSSYRNCVVLREQFKAQIRQEFGDLRYKRTWEQALARYEALNIFHDCLDASYLVLHALNFVPERWDYEYRHQIFNEFLTISGSLELLKLALEQVLSNSFSTIEWSQAGGFYNLVAEQAGREQRLPVELARRVPVLSNDS
ncbi:MAG: hypothetical protein HC795_14640 [Coleofasciculaceae cyanobacterium RL_1_1]|nr:hypothetical protein [Coleofasciculaceae cyanobacterium RL_1_1]